MLVPVSKPRDFLSHSRELPYIPVEAHRQSVGHGGIQSREKPIGTKYFSNIGNTSVNLEGIYNMS
ncbi:hypothetical protein UPYG_G00070970 [Umbra pygmaea]|uniref:Uncharacterized protein n=1 Tax=Umbra pygmaea TaxID=75934 RepID=A0ABD0XEH1_UMBPY